MDPHWCLNRGLQNVLVREYTKYMKVSAPPVKEKPRDENGHYLGKDLPPLINFSISNPMTYLKLWWNKTIANEGVDVKFRIRPLTMITLAAVFAFGGFGLGRLSVPLPAPITKYLPQLAPPPTPDPWKDTAFAGLLHYATTTKTFYLETQAAEAITLEVPQALNLSKYVGRRIFATGKFNTVTGVLVVGETEDLELLPTQVTHIPAASSSPSPSPTDL